MDICSLSLVELVEQLQAATITSQEVVAAYLERIAMNDTDGPMLNAVPIVHPEALNIAIERDAERNRGEIRGRLHGVPFLVKDSFAVKGLPVSNGSPAFFNCIAQHDSWIVERLKAEGAIVLGKTTMPPMAAGGMQDGLYGKSRSPFNQLYHPAAWFSGSSQGSGVGLAAGYAPFTIGEETVSSGRSPASYNGIVCYTPSNGLMSLDYSWPLLPLRDVVAPFTRNMEDLFFLLPMLWSKPENVATDFWQRQGYIQVFDPATALQDLQDSEKAISREQVRLGIADRWDVRDGPDGAAVPSSVTQLQRSTVEKLQQAGFQIEITDFPVMDDYSDHGVLTPNPDSLSSAVQSIANNEFSSVATAGWEFFLRNNGCDNISSLSDIDPEDIFPEGFKGLPAKYNPLPPINIDPRVVDLSNAQLEAFLFGNPEIGSAIEALDRYRHTALDAWMRAKDFDVLMFLANTDHASINAGISPQATVRAWEEGVACSTGNFMVRQLGLPTVTLPIGVRSDNDMPVGITLLTRPGQDAKLLKIAHQVERAIAVIRPHPKRVVTTQG